MYIYICMCVCMYVCMYVCIVSVYMYIVLDAHSLRYTCLHAILYTKSLSEELNELCSTLEARDCFGPQALDHWRQSVGSVQKLGEGPNHWFPLLWETPLFGVLVEMRMRGLVRLNRS